MSFSSFFLASDSSYGRKGYPCVMLIFGYLLLRVVSFYSTILACFCFPGSNHSQDCYPSPDKGYGVRGSHISGSSLRVEIRSSCRRVLYSFS
jgi:hypothetical protein